MKTIYKYVNNASCWAKSIAIFREQRDERRAESTLLITNNLPQHPSIPALLLHRCTAAPLSIASLPIINGYLTRSIRVFDRMNWVIVNRSLLPAVYLAVLLSIFPSSHPVYRYRTCQSTTSQHLRSLTPFAQIKGACCTSLLTIPDANHRWPDTRRRTCSGVHKEHKEPPRNTDAKPTGLSACSVTFPAE